MYKIMLLVSAKDGTYKFMTEVSNGVKKDVEFTDPVALDDYVEKMLNDTYSKKDFIIVKVKDFVVEATFPADS